MANFHLQQAKQSRPPESFGNKIIGQCTLVGAQKEQLAQIIAHKYQENKQVWQIYESISMGIHIPTRKQNIPSVPGRLYNFFIYTLGVQYDDFAINMYLEDTLLSKKYFCTATW